MKIAIVGLAAGEPYEYGDILMAEDIEITCVWDYEHCKADEYHRRFRGTVIVDYDQVPDVGVDGAVVTVHRGAHARYAVPLIEGGVPVLIGNPTDMQPADVERIDEAVREHGTPVMPALEDAVETMDAFLSLCDTGVMPTQQKA